MKQQYASRSSPSPLGQYLKLSSSRAIKGRMGEQNFTTVAPPPLSLLCSFSFFSLFTFYHLSSLCFLSTLSLHFVYFSHFSLHYAPFILLSLSTSSSFFILPFRSTHLSSRIFALHLYSLHSVSLNSALLSPYYLQNMFPSLYSYISLSLNNFP